MSRSVCYIPARSGSERIRDKNIRPVTEHGHPMMAYSIRCALESDVFDRVIVVTDSSEYARVAAFYGAEVPLVRPAEISASESPDIDWLVWIDSYLTSVGYSYDEFAILRPTSPFRNPATVRLALENLRGNGFADSVRAVSRVREHPGKMWILADQIMKPLLPFANGVVPWHSCQTKILPEVYVQNASLEFARRRVIEQGSISGELIMYLISQDLEGFDVNNPEDLVLMEHYLGRGIEHLSFMDAHPVYRNN